MIQCDNATKQVLGEPDVPRVATVRVDRDRLRAAIDASDLTRTAIAARAGLSQATIDRLVSGRAIGRRSAIAVAKVLGLRLDSLIAVDSSAAESEPRQGRDSDRALAPAAVSTASTPWRVAAAMKECGVCDKE